MNLKIEKSNIERVRVLMLRITPNAENKHDFNEAFVIVSRMLFAEKIIEIGKPKNPLGEPGKTKEIVFG